MTDFFHITMDEQEIGKISNLGLAHLGDAVYELMVRAWLCQTGKVTSKGLHAAAVSYVSAPAQTAAAQKILPGLTDEELRIFKRGRNTRVNSVPAHATLEEYHTATGLETLFGYLYLHGRTERLNKLFAALTEEF